MKIRFSWLRTVSCYGLIVPCRHCCTAAILQWRWLVFIPASQNCCNTVRSGVYLNCYRSCYHSTMTVKFCQDSGKHGRHHCLYFA